MLVALIKERSIAGFLLVFDLRSPPAGTFSFSGYEALSQDDHRKFEQAFTTKVRQSG